jgi:hypothetical protein
MKPYKKEIKKAELHKDKNLQNKHAKELFYTLPTPAGHSGFS